MSEPDQRLDALWRAFAKVTDPEIGLDIVTLGLVYDIKMSGDIACITHTLTTPGCPMEPFITDGIRGAAALVDGVGPVELRLVWEPAWHPGLIPPDAWAQ